MGKWQLEYHNAGTGLWNVLIAEFDQINQELTGDTTATFWLANTSANRALIQLDLPLRIWFDSKLQFSGILSGGDLGAKRIKAICYEKVPLTLDQYDTYTKVWDVTPANTIIADVLSGTGLTSEAASEPTTPLSVVFYNANRLDIIKFIAESTGKDFWSDDGIQIKWGVRGTGNLWAPTTLCYSRRGIDRSKK